MSSNNHDSSAKSVAPIQWRFALVFVICNWPILFWPVLLNGSNPFFALVVAWLPLSGIHFVVPVLDSLLPRDNRPAIAGQTHWLNKLFPMLCLPLWLLALFTACFQLTGNAFELANATYPTWLRSLEFLGVLLSLGSIGGTLAINPAHELIHRSSKLERTTGGLLLAATCYGAFKIEHVRGHHLNVATSKDTASARRGENLFAFIVKSIWGTFSHARRLELQRLERAAVKPLSLNGLMQNELLHLNLISLAIGSLLWVIAGWLGVILFIATAMGAIFQLEVINFIEHYGLERAIDPTTGRPETVKPIHSWNTSTAAGNLFLFNLQRHSDHHAHAGKDYLHLDNCLEAPQLPYGYGLMYIIACVPPLWRKVMHPRLDALKN